MLRAWRKEKAAAQAVDPVVILSTDDLRALAALSDRGVEGAIVGKALYAGAFTPLPEWPVWWRWPSAMRRMGQCLAESLSWAVLAASHS